MKKITCILLSALLLCSCELDDKFNDSHIYTTAYPVEYGTRFLYGEYAKISSVYPNGSDSSYEITDKKKELFSNSEMFIYSGVAGEAYLAKDLLNLNDKIKIIDATKGMSTTGQMEELWLDPSNYLMLCSNIKASLIEYNDNIYTKEAIETKYKELNEKVSGLDVNLYNVGKSANYNSLLVTNNVFNYLAKYNINVISIDEDNELIDKAYADAKKLVTSKDIEYIYSLEGEELNEQQEKFISENNLVKVPIKRLYTITDENRTNGDDYITIMNNIIDEFKKELYKTK